MIASSRAYFATPRGCSAVANFDPEKRVTACPHSPAPFFVGPLPQCALVCSNSPTLLMNGTEAELGPRTGETERWQPKNTLLRTKIAVQILGMATVILGSRDIGEPRSTL